MARPDHSGSRGPYDEPHFDVDAPIYPEGLRPAEAASPRRRGGGVARAGWWLGTLVAGLAAGATWVVQPLRRDLGAAQSLSEAASQRVALLESRLQAQATAAQGVPGAGLPPHRDAPEAPAPPTEAASTAEAAQALGARLAQALDGPMSRGHVAVHQQELAVVLRVPSDVAAGAQLPPLLHTVAQVLAATPGANQSLGLEVRLLGTPPRHRRGRDIFAARLAALMRAIDADWHHGPGDLSWHVTLGARDRPWGSLVLRIGPRLGAVGEND